MARLRADACRRARGSGRAIAIACILLVVRIVEASDEPRLEFARHGDAVATKTRTSLRAESADRRVRVHEPYEARVVEFEAVPLPALLDAVYSPSWREEQEILFTCRDGYQPILPVKRVLAHDAWLAFARTDQETFTIRKHESGEIRTVDVGPYYVVWENLDDKTIRQEGDYGWPYQVVAIDLIDSRERFPAMAPPVDAPAEVLAGFEAFRVHCAKCHRVNGEGGTIGPELNPASGSGEYYDRTWLRTWIEDPAKIRPKTRMPPLNPALPNRAETVDQIMAYLYAMAGGADDLRDSDPPREDGTSEAPRPRPDPIAGEAG